MDAYTQGLAWLARRELSERQLRQRLATRGMDESAIDAAVDRLTRERALDDRRVAAAYARTAVRIKGRARERVRREIEALGVARDLAKAAVDEVFAEVDESSLLERAVEKQWKARLRSAGRRSAEPQADAPDRRDVQRIYQALVRQGFPADQVRQALRRRRATDASLPEPRSDTESEPESEAESE